MIRIRVMLISNWECYISL